MADFQSPPSDISPQPPRERQGSMSLGSAAPSAGPAAATAGPGAPPPNTNNSGIKSPTGPEPGSVEAKVKEVLSSELGVATLLERLKQSIASAKEFALFLKKRSTLEEEHAGGLRKLCRVTQENLRRPEHRQGSFAQAYEEMTYIHERMAENGMQFALSLHQMHDDLMELAAVAERSRKGWKANGLEAERRVAEFEAAMRKSKHKYDALADEYDRARTGDSRQSGGKISLFKATKSAAQQEEDLLRKVQGADTDYHGRVQTLQAERGELITRLRPEAVKALQDLVKETDAGLTLQMQKFASFNEKLLLSNGLSISPIKNQGAEGANQPRSLREAIMAINNEKDLNDFVLTQYGRMPPNKGEPKYERNPVLNPPAGMNPQANMSMPPHMAQMSPQGQFPVQPLGGQGPPPSLATQGRASTGGFGPGMGSPLSGAPMGPSSYGPGGILQGQRPSSSQQGQGQRPSSSSQQQPPAPIYSHGRSFSQSTMLSQQSTPQAQGGPTPQSQQQGQPGYGMRNSSGGAPVSRFGNGQAPSQGLSQGGPPQLGALPFQSAQQTPSQQQPLPQQQQQLPLRQGPPQDPSHGSPQGPPPSFQGMHQRQGSASMGPGGQGPISGPIPQNPAPAAAAGLASRRSPSPQMQAQQQQQARAGSPAMMGGMKKPSPSGAVPAAAASAHPSKPVFGLTLSKLYERDGLAVPMVVYQCIQAVDIYGLGMEGIYRQSGSLNHITKLKNMFDTDSTSLALDFRNPENFYHDVNSVTGLLKQFFRDLPDPLLTMEHHQGFIQAAKHEDDIVRRDSLHAIINSLPDPNYATLRALTLHLYRVMENSHTNRMNCHNLAVIFGPTLMGTDPSTSIADAGWQIKVVDTILQNTYQIFDDD